ncbi:hypothetical protein M409DRAFT_20724 [Zasmidium cellare ATCC 36951]|uniref:Cytochrome P450 n=1 Tax=Zasmidium cellare ATCC 36951 TaxID=1080233 RepID=A0A6A6CN63_ZASCE|nr:uncharacterized protein M409DRAFT_20724 [Zasmidium cellare ATCC 36951]KAF2168707.1 hypothetical protein M409DRAFT_20724 [Zasmidium cellare ATCC 36951]
MTMLSPDGRIEKGVLLLLGAAFLLLTVFSICLVRAAYFSPLSKYPGPKLWAATLLPNAWARYNGKFLPKVLQMHQKYGRVVRVGPNDLSWIDERVWKDVFEHRQNHQEFPKWRVGPALNGYRGILSSDREDHSRYRRLLSHEFSAQSMKNQQPIIMGYVDLLIRGLRDCSPQEPQDMVQWFNWATFDIIGRLSFGEDFNCLRNREVYEWITAVMGNVKAVSVTTALTQLGLGRLAPYFVSKELVGKRRANYEYAAMKIAERSQMQADNDDFLDNVYHHMGKKSGMVEGEIVANASNLVLGGSETTATLLSGCAYLLAKSPDKLRNVQNEIRTTFASEDEIDLFSVVKLPYTLAVLNETMRIYPPVPNMRGRSVPYPGDTVAGEWVPGGTKIMLPQYVAGRLASNFRQAEDFIPERFLGDPRFENDNFAIFQPFSAGPRNCIGKNLAYAEMRLILAKFLYNFEIELDASSYDWISQKEFTLWEKPSLWMRVKAIEH